MTTVTSENKTATGSGQSSGRPPTSAPSVYKTLALTTFVMVVIALSAYEPDDSAAELAHPAPAFDVREKGADSPSKASRNSGDAHYEVPVQKLARMMVPAPIARVIVEHCFWDASLAVVAILGGWVGVRRRSAESGDAQRA